MKTLSDYIGQTLKFVEPAMLKQICELRVGDETIAKIRSPKLFSSLMVVEGSFGNWEIYRPNFWKSLVAIRESGYELPIATYEGKFFSGKGTVNLPQGERLYVVFHAFKKFYEIQNSYGERIVLFTPRFSWGGEKTDIVIEKRSTLLDKYPWVIMLVRYLALQRKRSHAAAAAH